MIFSEFCLREPQRDAEHPEPLAFSSRPSGHSPAHRFTINTHTSEPRSSSELCLRLPQRCAGHPEPLAFSFTAQQPLFSAQFDHIGAVRLRAAAMHSGMDWRPHLQQQLRSASRSKRTSWCGLCVSCPGWTLLSSSRHCALQSLKTS